MLDGKQLTRRNSVLDRWGGLRDSWNCWWNMHSFTPLFDLYSARSCSGVLSLQRSPLVKRRGEMWRHRVQSDDCCSIRFSHQGTQVNIYLDKVKSSCWTPVVTQFLSHSCPFFHDKVFRILCRVCFWYADSAARHTTQRTWVSFETVESWGELGKTSALTLCLPLSLSEIETHTQQRNAFSFSLQDREWGGKRDCKRPY